MPTASSRTYAAVDLLTEGLLADAADQLHAAQVWHARALLLPTPDASPDLTSLTGPDGPAVAADLVAALHGARMIPADPTWWSTPLGVLCSSALALTAPEQIDRLPPVTLAEAGHIMGVSKGSVSQLRARGRLPRAEGVGGAATLDARTVHAEAIRLRSQRAAGYDRTAR